MTILQFTVPSIPHYIMCGEDTYFLNDSHPNRRNIEVFDLLVVTSGELFIGEEDRQWSVKAGETLILNPDRFHYATQNCKESTHFFWLHFQTTGKWQEINDTNEVKKIQKTHITPFHQSELFTIELPKYGSLSNPKVIYEKLRNLLQLVGNISYQSRVQEQALFQEILMHLHADQQPKVNATMLHIAELAANYLQQHFHQAITYEKIGEDLNFHPAYITRCMKQVYGCTPQEYLEKYRIEQSKIFLLNTDKTVGEIAEKVGYSTTSYFTKTFSKISKISPLKFRNQYR
jgi:YesN/AraC family two-component response regulator